MTIKKCKKCERKTEHIKRGFGTPGSLSGNARWCCLNCEENDDLENTDGRKYE